MEPGTLRTLGMGGGGGLESEFNHMARDSTSHTYNETPIKALAPDLGGASLIESMGMQEADTFQILW